VWDVGIFLALLVCLGVSECCCCIQGNIINCDDKFALALGCRQVNDVVGKDIVQFIPSITICDNSSTGPQVCWLRVFDNISSASMHLYLRSLKMLYISACLRNFW